MDAAQWMARLQQGDPEALEWLLTRYGGMLQYILGGMLERSSPATWLTALCRNAAFDRLRQLQRQGTEEISEHHPDPAPGPEELLLQKERRERLQAALNALSARDRNLIYRKYYYLQSTARMAAELGLTERAVEGRLYRIRQKLQKKLGGELL